jgi:serine/threonine-protein kinase
MDYKGEIADAVARLRAVVHVYDDLQHTSLIRLVRHFPVGGGYAAVFDWADGEGFFSYWDYSLWEMKNNPQSPNVRWGVFTQRKLFRNYSKLSRMMCTWSLRSAKTKDTIIEYESLHKRLPTFF